MAIQYFGSDNNGSFVRPLSYTFPAGLNTVVAGGPTSVDYLVVAGGGGGAFGSACGGGGAGGLLTGTGTSITTGTDYSITVGAGGPGATSGEGTPANFGANGSNSIFSCSFISLAALICRPLAFFLFSALI